MLRLENISFQADEKTEILKNIDLEIDDRFTAITGPNGGGKSTLAKVIAGILKPTTGRIWLDGTDITGKKTAQINMAGIARTFQNIRLFKQMSVIDNVKCALQHQYVYGTPAAILHLGEYRKKEREMDDRAMSILSVFGLEKERDTLLHRQP